MTVEAAASFFVIIFLFGITPGPGVFAIIARALVDGGRSCLPLAFGMAVMDIVYLIAACFGLAMVARQWGEFFMVVRVLGALYLAYLGWKMWTAPVSSGNYAVRSAGQSIPLSLVQGFLISASNPKVILFYIAFLPTFLDVQQLGLADIGLVSLLTLLGLMLGLSLIAWVASSARRFFEQEHQAKVLNRSAGLIMMGAAAFLFLKS